MEVCSLRLNESHLIEYIFIPLNVGMIEKPKKSMKIILQIPK